MTEGVKDQEIAKPDNKVGNDKDLNFERLRKEREQDREARMRSEMENEMLRKEMEQIREMLKPKEADPLDSEDIDPELKARLTAKLSRERESYLKEAEKIANSVYENKRNEELKKSVPQRLKQEYQDFDQVMTQENIVELEQKYPAFVRAVVNVPDEYERKKAAYEFIKSTKVEVPSIVDKVVENQTNPYMIPSGAGAPSAVDFDLSSKSARDAAYAQLKANQRRPIGRN